VNNAKKTPAIPASGIIEMVNLLSLWVMVWKESLLGREKPTEFSAETLYSVHTRIYL
jgi:hypothetical protein